MEENNPIFIIENQNEQNVDQILDINNDNNDIIENIDNNENNENNDFFDKKDNEDNQKKESVESSDGELNEENTPRGYVRILRKIIKKKDDSRKNILQNNFKKWKDESLKDVTIKRTVLVRIAVSKDKDRKNKLNNSSSEDEKERNKSASKREVKPINYPQNVKIINNIRKETDGKESQTNIRKYIINKNNDNKNNNMENYEIAKRLKYYKPVNENKEKNRNNDKLNNNSNTNLKFQNHTILETKNEKIKATPKINNSDKTRKIYPISNLNIKYSEINNSYKKNTNNNSNNYIKFDQSRYQTTSKKETYSKPIKKYENMSTIYTSSTKKIKNDNPTKYNNYNNKYIIQKSKEVTKPKFNEISNVNVISNINGNGYHMKYQGSQGYRNNNNNVYISIPMKRSDNDLKSKIDKNPKVYQYQYGLNKSRVNIKDNTFGYNNYTHESNNSDVNMYNQRTYQVNNTIKVQKNYTNKVKDNNSNYNGKNNRSIENDSSNYRYRTIENESNSRYHRRNNNSVYNQNTAKAILKGGVTTVIQHYSGRRSQYEQYDKNTNNRNYKK